MVIKLEFRVLLTKLAGKNLILLYFSSFFFFLFPRSCLAPSLPPPSKIYLYLAQVYHIIFLSLCTQSLLHSRYLDMGWERTVAVKRRMKIQGALQGMQ